MNKQKFPIVLAQGIARFDILREILKEKLNIPDSLDDRLHYFKGIKTYLESQGFSVHHTDVDFAGSVQLRATQLAAQINNIINTTECEKVHVIAHSMAGLDARHMIVDVEGIADKVATLTTIAAPHLGKSLEDFVMSL